MKRSLSCIFTGILLLSCVPEQKIIEDNPFIIDEGKTPWIIAHGGSKALWPENTMMAFDGSMNIGVDALEMDVNLTKDGILVTHHDETIDRMSDGEGKVADYTYEELLQFNFGDGFVDTDGNTPYKNQNVPLAALEDVIIRYPSTPLIIEIKNSEELGEKAADELIRLIDAYQIQSHTIVASFSDDVIEYLSEETNNSLLVSAPSQQARRLVISTKSGFGLLHWPKSVAAQLPMESSGLNLAKKRIVKSAHRHNMAIHYWTINNKEDMELLIDLGADGLITDRPDLMKEVLKDL